MPKHYGEGEPLMLERIKTALETTLAAANIPGAGVQGGVDWPTGADWGAYA